MLGINPRISRILEYPISPHSFLQPCFIFSLSVLYYEKAQVRENLEELCSELSLTLYSHFHCNSYSVYVAQNTSEFYSKSAIFSMIMDSGYKSTLLYYFMFIS